MDRRPHRPRGQRAHGRHRPRHALSTLLLLAALLFSSAGPGCVALDSRHIGFTATSSFLRISKNEKDNQIFRDKPGAYTLAPLGFIGVMLLDVVLYPITGIHDLIVMLRGDPEGVPRPVDSYSHRYRQTIRTVIVNQ